MKKIEINSLVKPTDITLGIERLGVFSRKEECFELIDRYLGAGGNCIDTARLYSNGETDRVLGEWLQRSGRRNEVIIAAKGCHNSGRDGSPRLTKENIESDLEDAIRDLKTDHADIYYLHRDNVALSVSEIMPHLDKLIRSGKTLALGCSNWTAQRIIEANSFAKDNGLAPFSVSSILYGLGVTTAAATGDLTHIVMNDVEYGWYEEQRFPLMAYSSQSKGYFSKLAKGESPRPSAVRYFGWHPENARRLERAKALASELNTSVGAISLAFARDSGLNCSAIFTVSRLEQAREALDAARFSLTQEQVDYLRTGKVQPTDRAVF